MTGLDVQQTNRRMCRYVFVMFIFLCRPQDVYAQGLPSVSCEAGEVTVGEEATITCIFPTGTITPGNSNFAVKKFSASNPRDETDIMNCFHEIGSTSGIPTCCCPWSLGYNFTFVPGSDTQTVVIPSAKQSDAGEYGCNKINHMVARCNLTVKAGSKRDSDSDQSPHAIIITVFATLLVAGVSGGTAYIVRRCIIWEPKVAILPSASEDKALTMTMLRREYPREAWIWANVSFPLSVQIQYPNEICPQESRPTGGRCANYRKCLPFTNYRADLKALDHATNILSFTADPDPPIFNKTDAMLVLDALVHASNILSGTADPNAQIVFLTDAISVFDALVHATNTLSSTADPGAQNRPIFVKAATANKLPHLQKALQNIKCNRLVLQWIPSDCGFYSNEEADRMANVGVEEELYEYGVGIPEMNPVDYNELSRQEQVIIFRLRTSHNRLNFQAPKYFHCVSSPQCPCGEAEQTIEHILQDCGNHQLLREEIWPNHATLQEKLYGPVEELRKTIAFILRAELQV